MIRIAVALAAGLLLATPAGAAELQQSVEILAWSEDGRCVLLWEQRSLDNGGREHAYRLIDGKGQHKRVVVSDIPDPSAGAKAEKIKAKKCAKGLLGLVKHLARRGMTHVTGQPTCEDPGRRDLLVVDPSHAPVVSESWMVGDGKVFSAGDLRLALVGTDLVLSSGEAGAAPLATWPHHHEYLELSAALSPARNLLLVRNHWRDANSARVGVYFTKSGEPADFESVKVR